MQSLATFLTIAVPGVACGFLAGLFLAQWRMKLTGRVGKTFDIASILPLTLLMGAGFCGMAHMSCRAHACPIATVGMLPLSAFAIGYVAARLALARVHPDLIESARLQGFSELGLLFRVMVPAEKSTFAVGLTLSLLQIAGKLHAVAGISERVGAMARCAAASTALLVGIAWLICVVAGWGEKRSGDQIR